MWEFRGCRPWSHLLCQEKVDFHSFWTEVAAASDSVYRDDIHQFLELNSGQVLSDKGSIDQGHCAVSIYAYWGHYSQYCKRYIDGAIMPTSEGQLIIFTFLWSQCNYHSVKNWCLVRFSWFRFHQWASISALLDLATRKMFVKQVIWFKFLTATVTAERWLFQFLIHMMNVHESCWNLWFFTLFLLISCIFI